MLFQEKALSLKGPVGALQAKLVIPENPQPRIVVICHPHPLQGGTMENKVVTTLARAWRDLGAFALRFNYRGVAGNPGFFDHGKGETEDLLAVLQWVDQEFPDHQIDLAGFSFGTLVALRGSHAHACQQLVLVAPPVQYEGYPQLTQPACLIQGEKDEIVSALEVKSWANQQPVTPTVVLFAEVGHFFHGKLLELQQVVERYLTEQGS